VDVAVKGGKGLLLAVLKPQYKRDVPLGVLRKVQENFHQLIREKADRLVQQHALRLPELEPLLEMGFVKVWFEVPGMEAVSTTGWGRRGLRPG
jgi:hypothetical protein